MWCWGQDVRATPDLLAAFGLSRHAAPRAAADDVGTARPIGATRYVGELDDGGRLTLWAFGVAVRDRSSGRGIFLHRFQRGVRALPAGWAEASATSPDALPRMRRPACLVGRRRAGDWLDRLLAWIERYERWVATTRGPSHRRRTLARWEHPVVDAAGMADAWRDLRVAHRRAASAGPLECDKPFAIAGPFASAAASGANASRGLPGDGGVV